MSIAPEKKKILSLKLKWDKVGWTLHRFLAFHPNERMPDMLYMHNQILHVQQHVEMILTLEFNMKKVINGHLAQHR